MLATTLVAPRLVLLFAPALVLALMLVLGRFPGERVVHRLRARRRAPAARSRPESVSLPRPLLRVRQAGVTLAFSLAMRPPPLYH